jgi:hypothetical protein
LAIFFQNENIIKNKKECSITVFPFFSGKKKSEEFSSHLNPDFSL